jgi:3-phosphoglycerate kinase
VVFVGGELCIPFLALSGRVSFKQYQSLCADNRLVCLELVKKARMRGTKLLLPVDILSADEAIDAQLRRRCFDKFDADSRDEGADYNGEIKSVLVGYPENGPLAEEYTLVGPLKDYPQLEHYSVPKVSVEGFVYDIGEQSRKVLQEQLANCDLLVSWGPLGACEVSGAAPLARGGRGRASVQQPGLREQAAAYVGDRRQQRGVVFALRRPGWRAAG